MYGQIARIFIWMPVVIRRSLLVCRPIILVRPDSVGAIRFTAGIRWPRMTIAGGLAVLRLPSALLIWYVLIISVVLKPVGKSRLARLQPSGANGFRGRSLTSS